MTMFWWIIGIGSFVPWYVWLVICTSIIFGVMGPPEY